MPEKESGEFRGIIRVAGKDLNGKLVIGRALTKIRGIGVSLAQSIITVFEHEAGVPKTARVGDLTDQQISGLEAIIKNPVAHGILEWRVCRRKAAEGASVHLTGSDLDFAQRQDIELKKRLRTYHGVRHMYGLPVWGGCTRTRGRKGLTLGVIRKKQMPAKAGGKERGRGKERGKGRS